MPDFSLLDWAIALLIAQAVLGALDTLYHHELTVALPYRHSARLELSIHALRSCFYGILFLGIAHLTFQGTWAIVIGLLFALEIGLTLWDFVVEDRSRKLPAIERIMHTVLAVNGGAFFALYGVQLAQWASLPTGLGALDLGWRGWLLTLFAVGVSASGIRDGLAALRMQRRGKSGNPFAGGVHRRVLVTGGTGFIGEALVNQLLDAGHTVSVLARDPLKAAYLFDGRARCLRSLSKLGHDEIFDVVINLAGAPVAGPRWSPRRQAQLIASRVHTTEALINWLKNARNKPTLWVQASAIGFYGVRDASESLDERAAKGDGFMAELCARWEASALPAVELGLRQVVMRLGVVFGPGGALLPLLIPFRLGFGGRMGDGRQIMSWIHRDDVIQVIARAFDDESLNGTYNLVAPETVSQGAFAERVGKVLRRPVWFHIPAAPVRALAGEMAQLFFDGQRVVPSRLAEAGYRFRYPTLDAALRDLA
ncbi:TIGR01777 family protein [Pseudomonas corrugata]|uniref:TIGR01777 family protein n=1 Tax=Pseudomonas corrugata TaxID=47879 RepID=A0A7Y6DGG1_9PSED|nr:TIGR01777 family oxidoreductase [Pseudomonas corrugata]MCI0995741.1 TIGR01777 family protein [Pseudomonas corrugata]NUT63821.1 TIGR01777 family protein [Pseudomonas corrugata]NUT86054.1 TIGR01777 family protein [Pseudomonas corrugata]